MVNLPLLIEIAVLLTMVSSVFVWVYFFMPRNVKFTTIKIGNTGVKAEIADTTLGKMRGLMFRNSLGDNEGMLFLFDEEGYHGFWMMNTSIPLDIIWINSTKHVVHVEKNVQPCRITSCPSYKPSSPATYVLEVRAGFSDKHGIGIGTEAKFEI